MKKYLQIFILKIFAQQKQNKTNIFFSDEHLKFQIIQMFVTIACLISIAVQFRNRARESKQKRKIMKNNGKKIRHFWNNIKLL